MCVCTQVDCSVVCNWSLSDLFVDVCIVIYIGLIFLSIFLILLLRHQTMDKVQKHNSFNTNKVRNFHSCSLPHKAKDSSHYIYSSCEGLVPVPISELLLLFQYTVERNLFGRMWRGFSSEKNVDTPQRVL
jgi:hypothetical protein